MDNNAMNDLRAEAREVISAWGKSNRTDADFDAAVLELARIGEMMTIFR